MKIEIEVTEVIGGFKITGKIVADQQGALSHCGGTLGEAYLPQLHQLPQRIKDTLSLPFPKPEPKAKS